MNGFWNKTPQRAITVEDDLFSPQVVQEAINILRPKQKRIKCAICQRHELQSSLEGACVHCGSDVTATLTWIYNLAEATRERLHETAHTWEAALSKADEPLMDRFTAYQTSTDKAAQASANAAAQRGVTGPLADLIRLWLDYQQAQAKVYEIEAWVKNCEAVLLDSTQARARSEAA